MTAYQQQLQRVVDALRARQRVDGGPHSGGWGALLERSAPASIVNTSEAVSVFALAGVLPEDNSLRRGLTYLREKVHRHPDPAGTHPEARGAKTRYAAFGLMGLTAYSMPVDEPGHSAAIAACVTRLQRSFLDEGLDVDHFGQGWAEHPQVPRLSMLSTSVAARSLDRVPAGTTGTEAAREMAALARRRIRSLARGSGRERWWPSRADAPPFVGDEAASAAATALAILALAEGGPTSQQYARTGVSWLLSNADKWAHTRESDANVPDANWVHPNCPLGLRAVLVPCAGVDPARPELAIPISYLDRLWSDSAGEWLHGHPFSEPSTTADLHAAAAIRSMRRAWRGFDPVDHILSGHRRRTTAPAVAGGDKPFEVSWDGEQLRVLGADGSLLARRTFPVRATAMRSLLDALADCWRTAGRDATLVERSMTADELRARTQINDVYEYIRRLNVAVGEASMEQRGRSCVLVGRIESGKGLSRDRYALLGSRVTGA